MLKSTVPEYGVLIQEQTHHVLSLLVALSSLPGPWSWGEERAFSESLELGVG